MTSPLAAGGLIVDVVGALVIAVGLMWKRPEHWHEEAGTYVGMNTRLFVGLAIQTADAQVGATLLAFGFFTQFLASTGVAPDGLCLWLAIALGAAIGVLAVLFLLAYWRPRNLRRAVAYQLQTVDRDEWRVTLDSWGARLDRFPPAFMLLPRQWSRRSGELPGDYGRRFFGRGRWERLTGGVDPPVL